MSHIEEIRLTIAVLGWGGQTKLARHLSVNPRTVRRWLARRTKPHPVLLEKIIKLRADE
jgi:DNA-binding transcriptional regulator YiaG